MNPKNRKTLYYLLSLTVLTALFIIAGVYFLKTNGKTREKPDNENPSNATVEKLDSEDSRIEELSPDQKFYAHGVKNFENKNYEQAISDLGVAISVNPKVAVYYVLKSEAEFLAGKKDDAKATLEAGLKVDPNNELLNSKKDVLIKEYFQSSSFEATRE